MHHWLMPQNSKYPRAGPPSVPVAVSSPSTPRKVSHAAWFSAGSELTRSRIICQATMLRAPSGGGPIAKETEHCGAETNSLCRRFLPRSYPYGLREHIHGNRFVSRFELPITAQTMQVSQGSVPRGELPPRKNIVSMPLVQVGRKTPVVDGLASRTPCRKPQINSRARTELRRDNLPAGTILCSSQKRAASRTLWR